MGNFSAYVSAVLIVDSPLNTMLPTATTTSGLQTPTPDMAATFTVQASQTRTQPWKKHWPPKQDTEREKAYGVKEGASIVIYGNWT